jgi:acetyltransferase-like isoleucine patch superfamily enzyme
MSLVTIFTHSPQAVVTVGNRTRIYGARISCYFAIEIGDDVLIEDAGITDTDFHSIAPGRGEPVGEALDRCRVTIGNGVALGARSLVTKGVHIGAGAVVGPGAIVTRHLPAGCFALGNPARVIGRGGPNTAE